MTLIELIVATAIMMLLTYMAVPLARGRVRREKEHALHEALREIRHAIDQYKDHADKNEFGPIKVDTEGYPESLDILVDGQIAGITMQDVRAVAGRLVRLDKMASVCIGKPAVGQYTPETP